MTAGLYAPFPVEVPYRTGPVMKRLGGVEGDSGGLFVVDEAYGRYLEQKLSRLASQPERYGGLSVGPHGGLGDALLHVFSLLAREQPNLLTLEAGTVRLEALGLRLERNQQDHWRVEAIPDTDTPLAALGRRVQAHLEAQFDLTVLIHALALSLQEDFVILRDLDGEDEAECLCVVFPSDWNPQEKVGQNFSELHKPVANNTALLRSHRPVMNALFHKGPFVRFVWGLSADGRLGQHPAETPRAVTCSPAALFFRTERQVSVPLPGGRCLFTVRVAVQPLSDALCNEERRQRFAAALASMDDELLAYKGLSAWRDPLLAFLSG